MNNNNQLPDYLQRHPFFQDFSETSIEEVKKSSVMTAEPKGKILFLHEDKATKFYVIVSGWVKLYRETLDGSQAIIDILTNGHIFGETSLFENNTHPFTAEVAEDAEIIALPIAILRAEIETNPKIAMTMMTSMARHRRQQDQEIENMTLKNAPQRIGCFLMRLLRQDQISGHVVIHLPYDKTLIASRLGMQPETFSRALNKLKNTVNMTVKGSTIEIENIDDLIDYSCSACSSEFPCNDVKVI